MRDKTITPSNLRPMTIKLTTGGAVCDKLTDVKLFVTFSV